MTVLVLNAGSSSLKYQLMDMGDKSALAWGNCERIGLDGRVKYKNRAGAALERQATLQNHGQAFEEIVSLLTRGEQAVLKSLDEIAAIGHRVVFGTSEYQEPTLITDHVIDVILAAAEFAPLHTPPQVATIRSCKALLGDAVRQVAVFDTSFGRSIPPRAYLFGLPYRYYEQYGVRRYGFHGISHQYVSERAAGLMGRDVRDLKMVTCHIGGGASMNAIDRGACIDTSTGFATFDGLVMGTRVGAVDPMALLYIAEKEKLGFDGLLHMIANESGILGLSGLSGDDREIERASLEGHERAILAASVQRYQIKKYIGAFAFAMGGLDAVVFTAGAGENSPYLRGEACRGLEHFGIMLDEEKNFAAVRGVEGDISALCARVRVLVIPTNEELMIAMETVRIAGAL